MINLSKGFLDLHVHLRGTIGPSLAKLIANRNNDRVDIHPILFSNANKWENFSEFLDAYDAVARVVKTRADLEDVAYNYLASSGSSGTVYVEFMLSPPDLIRAGISYLEQLEALTSAWRRSKEQYGIESRLIVTCVRHFGPEAAIDVAKLASSFPHPYVVGFGLVGDERRYDTKEFARAFQIAKDAGLKLTAHAGEHCPAGTIRDAIINLKLDRVGHGIRAVDDADVVQLLRELNLGLEICLSSNVALGLIRSIEEHPLNTLLSAGIPISLGTDDPAFFWTSPKQEYELAAGITDLGPKVCEKISQHAIEMAFCDDITKAELKKNIALA